MTKKLFNKFYLFLLPFFCSGTSFAASNWQMGYNESVTSVMDDIVHLHDRILLPIIVAIS
ncbi:MAG: hypothetical protein RLZZ530_768, partial [Pseudomonadota bacterium]